MNVTLIYLSQVLVCFKYSGLIKEPNLRPNSQPAGAAVYFNHQTTGHGPYRKHNNTC